MWGNMKILRFPVRWHVSVIVILTTISVSCSAVPHGPAYYFEGDNTHYHDFSAYPVVYRHSQQPNSYNFNGAACKLTVVVPEHENDPNYHLYHPYENDEAFYYCVTPTPSTTTNQQQPPTQPQRQQQSPPLPFNPRYSPTPPRKQQTYFPPATTTTAPKNYNYPDRYPSRQYARPTQGTRGNYYPSNGSGRGVYSNNNSRNPYRQPDRYAGRYNTPRNYYNNRNNNNRNYYPTRSNNDYYNRRYAPPLRTSTVAPVYYPRNRQRPSSSYPYPRRRRPNNVVGYQRINNGNTNYYSDRDNYGDGSSRRRYYDDYK